MKGFLNKSAATAVLALAALVCFQLTAYSSPKASSNASSVKAPVNIAILIQDDLVARVGTELSTTRDFIEQLPPGSRVMVGYLSTGSLRIRQPFTTDLNKAASSLRIPISSTAASPYDPYVGVTDALKSFDKLEGGRNAILLISDGLDISRGWDIDSAANTVDLLHAIKEAQRRHVAVYSFYAPSVGLTSWNTTAISYGQSSLARISQETGGKAFFQGFDYVTFDPYFARLRDALNSQYGRAY